jgi:arsenite methyltransferase
MSSSPATPDRAAEATTAKVRERYASAARQARAGAQAIDCGCGQPAGCGCATSCCGPAEAGVANVEFLRGRIERIPLPAGSVDVIISNCVINLSVDKPAVFAEMRRVLAPGGRIGVSDMVAEDRLSPGERAERGDWAGCVAGALSIGEYRRGLAAAGFERISITPTHQVADGLHSAIITVTAPATS